MSPMVQFGKRGVGLFQVSKLTLNNDKLTGLDHDDYDDDDDDHDDDDYDVDDDIDQRHPSP